MEFILIPPGRIRVEGGRLFAIKPFLLAKTPVTQEMWREVMGSAPWQGENYVREAADYPAVYVSWDDAREFCRKTGLSLPSEVQWEYANEIPFGLEGISLASEWSSRRPFKYEVNEYSSALEVEIYSLEEEETRKFRPCLLL